MFAIYWTYCVACFAQVNYDHSKLSRYLENIIKQEKKENVKNIKTLKNDVCALMKVNAHDDASTISIVYGCQLLDSIGDIYIVNVPVSILGQLSLDERVLRIEAHELPRPSLNSIPEEVSANKVLKGIDLPQAFTGKGVVTGVVDFGFDFTHPMFYDADGIIRIRQYYDMTKTSEEGVRGVAYNSDELMDLKHSSLALSKTHGTHVASIMAGSGVKGEKDHYSGIAPESDIVLAEIGMEIGVDDYGKVVAGDLKNNPDGTSANLILAFKRIFDFADNEGKPCVINFSGGFHMPIIDPCILENEAMEALLGPGHLIVASSGNDGGLPTTMVKREDNHDVTAKFKGTLLDTVSTFSKARKAICYLLTEQPQRVTINFYGFKGHSINKSFSISTDTLEILHGDTCIFVDSVYKSIATVHAFKVLNTPYYVKNNLYQFEVELDIKNSSLTFSNWLESMGIGVSISSNYPCEMYATPCYTPFTLAEDPNTGEYSLCLSYEHTIAWPAEAENIIAVGATNQGKLTNFSSQGPSWAGYVKPEVVAPGVGVNAAYNRYSSTLEIDKSNFYDVVTDREGDSHHIFSQSGTSMASPIVAGAIALWLQAKPDLTPWEVKDIISQTCIHPDNSIEYPNNQYGYGLIDVYGGLLQILGIDNIELSKSQSDDVRFVLENNRLLAVYSSSNVPLGGKYSLYNLDGCIVMSSSGYSVDLSSLPNGLYAVQFDARETGKSASTMIRLK